MHSIMQLIPNGHLPAMILVGLILFSGVFFGRMMHRVQLPALMGYMLLGIIIGPAAANILPAAILHKLDFVTELALGFVAISIGFELNFKILKSQGKQLLSIVVWESTVTFIVVTAIGLLVTGNTPLSLLLGAVGVATAPAGTVAVIQENNARGPFARTLLAIVGFDDAIGVLIFGFSLAAAKFLLAVDAGAASHTVGQAASSKVNIGHALLAPLIEVGLSITVGIVIGLLVGLIVRRLGKSRDVFIITLGTIFLLAGISTMIPISLVLTAMVAGMTITNTQRRDTTERIAASVTEVTPFLFVLFFTLAGAHLNIFILPKLGLIGITYVVARSIGKISGAWIGCKLGKADSKTSRYLGISIISQAGLAIGLGLMTLQELSPLGPEAEAIAKNIIVTITATSIIFEIIGPILTRFSLKRMGEIRSPAH